MHKIALGDCCALMPKIRAGAVNFVLTDPPYGVQYRDRSGRSIANDAKLDWLAPAFREIHRVLADDSLAFSFYGWTRINHFMAAWRAAGFRVVGHVTFIKSYASSARFLSYRYENGYFLAKGQPRLPDQPPPDVIRFESTGNSLHPTQKPVSALQPLIEAFCPPGGLVLDPFAGSGSTGEAALRCGRRFVGIELDPKYHGAAAIRLDRLGEQLRMA
jgi:adenine-specific DNA-methyltransferase